MRSNMDWKGAPPGAPFFVAAPSGERPPTHPVRQRGRGVAMAWDASGGSIWGKMKGFPE
ncbi:MAG: hypothetical protein HLUCCO07_01015 [Rhodobacteraceae bacterium HLUCCO07]|nr:MAG: hypothetical protein HLUCCO07_01015 [Rhodobacteraceae bacterium HLUCCO07]